MKTDEKMEAEGGSAPNNASLPKYREAIADALFIDVPVFAFLAPQLVVPAFIGAAIAYTARKYGNSYLDKYLDSNITSQRLLKAAICGGIGNALKYGIRGSTTALPVILIGAFNGFMYEAFGPGQFCSKDKSFIANTIITFVNVMSIEALEGAVSVMMTTSAMVPAMMSGAKAGALIALSACVVPTLATKSYECLAGKSTDTAPRPSMCWNFIPNALMVSCNLCFASIVLPSSTPLIFIATAAMSYGTYYHVNKIVKEREAQAYLSLTP
jgi:hypothetical protein